MKQRSKEASTVKIIQYYESIGLVRKQNAARALATLLAPVGQKLGFSIDRIRELMRLWNRKRSIAEIRKVALTMRRRRRPQ